MRPSRSPLRSLIRTCVLRRAGLTALAAVTFLAPSLNLAGCGGDGAPPDPPVDVANPVEQAPSFLAVSRAAAGGDSDKDPALVRQMLSSGPASAFAPDSSFYLAVHRRELGKRWFLSAYLKQFFPDAVMAGAAMSLGTRVVSFRIQNGKLFVFDVDDRRQSSDTFGSDMVIDAYPIVDGATVGAPRSVLKDYVLVDPGAGLNRFGVVDDLFASGYVGPVNKFMVELSFSQNFREIKDGATFEQAFTGYTAAPRRNADGIEMNGFRASGVLGLALRRYSEGEGFVSTPMPDTAWYFPSYPKLVPNAGEVTVPVGKWNLRPGAKPVRWLISPLVKQASEHPELKALGIDLGEVVKAGIESWNVAFGYQALQAELAGPNDSFADDDKNYFIWDRNPSVGFAFADWRLNPNTGEIRGASVYFNELFVESALQSFPDEASSGPRAARVAAVPAARPSLAWEPIPRNPLCNLHPSPLAHARQGLQFGEGLPATRKERVEKAIAFIVAHEIGHTLGLRHNFKGSLVPPTSSVMDYTSDMIAASGVLPGAYDVQAVRYLYGLSNDPPALPFCNDGDLGGDPRCEVFDEGADPLVEFWGPFYTAYAQFFLESGIPEILPLNDLLMDVLVGFVQNARTPAERQAAWSFLMNDLRVPVSQDALAQYPTTYAAGVNTLVTRAFNKLVHDPALRRPPLLNGAPRPTPRPLDATQSANLLHELQGNLLNVDAIRTFPTRRQCVDVLKRMQTLPALDLLRSSRQTLATPGRPDPQALLDDLIARIDAAVSPYFLK